MEQGFKSSLSLTVSSLIVKLHNHYFRQFLVRMSVQFLQTTDHVFNRVLVDVGKSLQRDEIDQVSETKELWTGQSKRTSMTICHAWRETQLFKSVVSFFSFHSDGIARLNRVALWPLLVKRDLGNNSASQSVELRFHAMKDICSRPIRVLLDVLLNLVLFLFLGLHELFDGLNITSHADVDKFEAWLHLNHQLTVLEEVRSKVVF